MTKICLFAGTTEGRRLAEFLSKQDVELFVFVATEYGKSLLNSIDHIKLFPKRLSADEMQVLMEREQFDIVIDATHPYAVQVTENIADACKKSNTRYFRLLRNASNTSQEAVTVPDIRSAVDFLNKTSGNILLTTGSKEIHKFSELQDFSERVYARVLPMPESIIACAEAGLKPSHIIAMQGPFSEEMNTATLNNIHAKWMVTKDSGDPGGFEAKLNAAQKTETGVLVIGRPPQRDGFSESEIITILCDQFGFRSSPAVSIIGIGPGENAFLTERAVQIIESADCLIGAKRMLASVSNAKQKFEAIDPQIISDLIHEHREYRHYAILMSGDSGFYSGTKRLLPLLKDCETEIIPGISSLSYLCAKLGLSYEDIKTVSLHGTTQDIIPDVRSSKKIFILTGGNNSVNSVCQMLLVNGMDDLRLTIGERLSYPDERIISGSPSDLISGTYDQLSVVLIENNHPDMIVTYGLPDQAFLRNTGEKGIIPMTKSEIRSICLSKLRLTEDALCWDIGSGTGSISIEIGLQAKHGHIYAIEKNPEAIELSKKNACRLHVSNISFIQGTAPEACTDLPTPTHVFIGGCSGKTDAIIQMLFSKKSEIRIVATAVTLETIGELNTIIRKYPFAKTDVTMVQIAHGKKTGEHHLMIGSNPIYVFSMRISEQI